MTNPTGQSYSAKMDGTDAPYKGDPVIDGVSVLRLGEHTLMETGKHQGKPIRNTRLMILQGQEKMIHMIVEDSLRGTSIGLVADKQ